MSSEPRSELRLMIVDESIEMIELVESMLRQLGYQHLASRVGVEEAWHDLPRFRPDIVIIEGAIERANGFDLTRRMRGGDEAATRDVPIILLSSQPRTEEIRAALDAGVNQVLVKPITARALGGRIEAMAQAVPRAHIQDCA